MTAVPTPTLVFPREEWPDADFDLPEGAPIPAPSDREEEDWDMEMDLAEAGGAKPKSFSAILPPRSDLTSSVSGSSMINIRPPIQPTAVDDDDEGVSTIKASAMSTITAKPVAKPAVEPVDEDFEEAYSLPAELTQLSLAPLSLSHRASKNSLEWGEKDNSSSSQSSDAYSSLGFAEASSSSNSTSSASLPDTETEEDEDELEGIVIPPALFGSGHSASQLKKILECKKIPRPKGNFGRPSKVDPEDDFEAGLVLDDDVDLSPSRLIVTTHHLQRSTNHSSIPIHKQSVLRPPSRTKLQRSKSPSIPPTSSSKQLQKLRLSPSPPLYPPSRSQNFQALGSNFQSASSLSPPSGDLLKPVSLRGQKSCTGLKSPSPPSTKRLSRKASLSSLFEASNALASGSTPRPTEAKTSRYEEPTAASRAKSHKTSMSRIHDFKVPPTRPSTPSSNTAALRLTMPTQSRLRSRPALSQVFGAPATPSQESPVPRALSPPPPRPPSSSSLKTSTISRSQTQPTPTPLAPKLLRRPKRPRTYGDGTELDNIEDLPTDRDKEVRYRVEAKGYGNRIPGATYASKTAEKSKTMDQGTARRKGKWEGLTQEPPKLFHAPSTNTLRRTTTRIDIPETVPGIEWSSKKKKKKSTPSGNGRRKPTLIRNLNGTSAPKVVGEMKWNPQTLRWEGNEQILRDFDAAIGTSTRPALITHLTASYIGSPGGSSSARVVGNMVFDPSRMCWMSTLPPEQEEPDVFADLADDEEDEWDQKRATIRANVPRVSDVSATSNLSDAPTESTSPTPSRARSESGSERGSRASMVVCDIDDAFIASCRKAEERHRVEMKGWKTSSSHRNASLASDRSYLYEIRALATRQY